MESLWPKNIELVEDDILKFLREQGGLLPDVTEGLLEARVNYSCFNPHTPNQKETVHYIIRPENGFLHSLGYTLFSFERELGVFYPVTINAFPRTPDFAYQAIAVDYKNFVTQYVQIVKSETAKAIIAHMMNMVKGYRADDLDPIEYKLTKPTPVVLPPITSE